MRRSWTRVTALALAAVLAAGSLVASGPQLTRPRPVEVLRASAPTEFEAVATARRTGRDVEVTTGRTERTTLFAHPDGTFTREHHVRPIRTLRGRTWVPVDDTMVRNADGTVGPRASTVAMRFSGGGTGPLATVTRMGRTMRLTWPGLLPAPVLDGSRATYREVLPDVDLVVNADVSGFSHVLVLKTQRAARNPKLATIAFGLRSERMALRVERGGLVAADAGTGGVVFAAQPPRMWDSGTGLTPGEESRPWVSAPESARTAPVGLRLDRGRLLLTPDAAMLADPDVRYPLYVDPVWGAAQHNQNWTMVDSGYAGNAYWHWQGSGNTDNQRVGLCPRDTSPDCNNGRIKRIFFEVPTGDYTDDAIEILQADFHVSVKHVENTHLTYYTELWRTGSISSGTSWNSQPGGTGWSGGTYQSRTDTHGTRACSDPNRNLALDATGALREANTYDWSSTTFGLKADDEGTYRNNRRFCHNAYVSVHYNKKPAAPTNLTSNPGGDCRTGTARPFTDKPPVLTAYLSDPDTGDGEPLTAEFTVIWTPSGGTQQTRTWESGAKANGDFVNYDLNVPGTGVPTLPQNTVITWKARASDGMVGNVKSWGPHSASCEFVIDATQPAGPDIDSVEYLPADAADDGNSDTWSVCQEEAAERDGVGRYGTFTFKSKDTDVVAYKYGLDTTPNQTVAAGTGTGRPASVRWVPLAEGPHKVYVRAVDGAGLESPIDSVCTFKVKKGSDPIAKWALDDPVGSTGAADARGRYPAAAGSGVTFGAVGPNGFSAARLDGTPSGGLATASTGLVDTSGPFTVSAWAKLDSDAGPQIVASQDGTGEPGFVLGYDASKKWIFSMQRTDVSSLGAWFVLSATTATVGKWTHLLAAYDPYRNQISLQVDGTTAQTAAHRSRWASHGNVQIGRRTYKSGYGDHWRGELAEVALYDRLAAPGEIMLPIAAKRSGYWDLDGLNAAGTTTREYAEWQAAPTDDAGDRAALTLSGPTLVRTTGEPQTPEDPPAETALMGEGHLRFVASEQDHLFSTAQLLGRRTSFSVAARVRLVAGCVDEQVVLSQPGEARNRFTVRCRGGRWELAMTNSDDAGSAETVLQGVIGEADYVETGQHIAVTFNAVDGVLRLYVDGALASSATGAHTAEWNGVLDGLRVGRGATGDGYLSGDVDEVRAYSGALTTTQVQQIGSRTVLPDL